MGWFKKAKKKFRKAIKKAAAAVTNAVNTVANAVVTAIDAVGSAVHDGLDRLAEKTGMEFFSWAGAVIKASLTLASAVIGGGLNMLAGTLGGAIKLVAGTLTFDGALVGEGLLDTTSPAIGFAIVVFMSSLALVHVTLFMATDRPLTDKEEATLRRVFATSLNYRVIRVADGYNMGLFGLGTGAFVIGNTIYCKEGPPSHALLVHEGTHVWQYQHQGVRYSSDAVGGRFRGWDAYNWSKEIDIGGKSQWVDFTEEAQAEFLEDVWVDGSLVDVDGREIATGKGVFYDADWLKALGLFEVELPERSVPVMQEDWFPNRLNLTYESAPAETKDFTTLARQAVTSVRDGDLGLGKTALLGG